MSPNEDNERDESRVEAAAVEAEERPVENADTSASGFALGSRTKPPVMVKLERFEGPLDLLLHLIKRDEIDIYDIPIAHITQQYLAYIEMMRSLDLEVAGEFLVMAATLMRIKAKMLLPLPSAGEEEDEGDPREELVQRLVEYRQFKEAAGTLKLREEERRMLFERGLVPGEDEAGPLPLAPATLFDLLDALNRVLARVPEATVYEVRREAYDVDDKLVLITRLVEEHSSILFADLLLRCQDRAEMIVTFIALLELIKLGQVSIIQDENFGDISIVARTPEGSEPDASGQSASGA
jgi:segregation and condensation protein A